MACLPHLAQPWHLEVKEVDWDFSVLSKQKVFYSTKFHDDDDDANDDYDLLRECSIVRELQSSEIRWPSK